jgi:colanic acid/amylovoran biosynthesis protein
LQLRAVMARLGGMRTLAVSSNLGGWKLPDGLFRVGWSRQHLGGTAIFRGSVRNTLLALRKHATLGICSRAMLERHGVLRGEQLTSLVDCSGFGYGDCWPLRRMAGRAEYLRFLKSRGVKLVMLPQAVGPFKNDEIRGPARALISAFDLIFVRDEASALHLIDLGLDPEMIYLAPDITHRIGGLPPREPAIWANRVFIVPNARMVDKTSPQTSSRYLAFLAACIRAVTRRGLEPCLMLHEANDLALAREARMASGIHVPILDCDPLSSKGLLGACRAVVSSRYQALVGALSQGTPALGTGWSHKFAGLFDDYDARDWLVSPRATEAQVGDWIDALVAPAQLAERRCRLGELSTGAQVRVEAMWSRVEALLSNQVSAAATPS